MKNNLFIIILLISLVFLTSCGGGGGSTPISSSTNVSYAFTGVAVDPYIQNAKFYIDKNDDGVYSDGEPLSSASDENGVFGFTESANKGDKIRMHPDNMGTHSGQTYTGELLESEFDPEKIQDDKTVISPLTTLKQILDLNETDLVSLINQSFDQSILTEADIYVDPIKDLLSDDFTKIQANITTALILNGLKDSSSIKSTIKVMDSNEKLQELFKLFSPVASSVKESLNDAKWTTVKNTLQDDQYPTPDVQSFVYAALESNSHFSEDMNTAITNGITDVKSFCDSVNVIMIEKKDEAKEEILKYALKKYLDDNMITLMNNDLYETLKTNAANLTGDFDFFNGDFAALPGGFSSDLFTYESGFVMQPYLKDAVFYVDADNDGVYDSDEDSQEQISSFSDETGKFYFDDPVYEGQTIRMHQYAKGEDEGLEYNGEEFERVITDDLFNDEIVISPLTTAVSKYEMEPDDIAEVLNTVLADATLFSKEDVYSDLLNAFSGKDTVEVNINNKLCASSAVNDVLQIFSQNDDFTTFINNMTLTEKKTFLINLLTPVVQKLQVSMDQDLLQDVFDKIILVAQPDLVLSPFYGYDFDIWPNVDLNEILQMSKKFDKILINKIIAGIGSIDLTADKTVVSTQIVNAFTNAISSISVLETTQKITDLLLLTYLKDNYFVFMEEGYLDTAKQIFSLLGSQADYSSLLDNLNHSSVIDIDDNGNIVLD